MGDEFGQLGDVIGDIVGGNVGTDPDTLQGLVEAGQTVNECAELVASLHDRIESDISECLNSCHGDVGLCKACIEGDIERYVNEAGRNAMACGDKIIAAVNAALGNAISSAIGLGIGPPTVEQLDAARNGQPIPDNPVEVVIGDDGIPIPVNPPVFIPVANPPVVAPPPQGSCLPNTWVRDDIYNWCQNWYGFDAKGFVDTDPTQTSEGVYVDSKGQHVIPFLCPDVPGGPVIVPPKPPAPPVYIPPVIIYPPSGTGTSVNPPSPPSTAPPASGPITPVVGGPGQTIPPEPPVTPPITVDDCNARKLKYCQDTFGGLGGNQRLSADGGYCLYTTNSPQYPDEYFSAIPSSVCGPAETPPVAPPTPTPIPIDPPRTEPIAGDPSMLSCGPSDIHIWEDFIAKGTNSEEHQKNFKCTDGVARWLVAEFSSIVNPFSSGSAGPFFSYLSNTLECFTKWIYDNTITTWFPQGSCDKDRALSSAISSVIPRLINKYTSAVPPSVMKSLDQRENFLCQYLIPSTIEASIAANKGYLTQEQAEHIWKLNGDCVPWRRVIQDSQHTPIGIQDAYRLWVLGKITGDEFIDAFKRNGVDTEKDREKFIAAIQQYPPMGDLIRMMVRDVGDASVVERLKLDGEGAESFENKWTGELKQWGSAQGVTDDIARKYWQAHWQNPSPQAIFEWLHRLRPDDRNPDDPFIKLVVTQEDAKKYLQISDYVPGLVDNYIATSYRPLTRVDIRRMYTIGAIPDLAGVRRAYRDLGYDDANARLQTRFTELTSAPAKAKLDGKLSQTEIVNSYIKNLLTEDEAKALLKSAGLTEDQVDNAILSANIRQRNASRAIAVKSLRQRFFMGEYTTGKASDELANLYMPKDMANRVVNDWLTERFARQKSPTVAVLCKWYGKGMITLDDMLMRVRNLNYNEGDALRIVESCNTDVKAKRQAEIEQALTKQVKAQQAINREEARQLREARQAANALKLRHKIKRKVQVKRDDGSIETTVTETVTDTPDVNITNISETVDKNGVAPQT